MNQTKKFSFATMAVLTALTLGACVVEPAHVHRHYAGAVVVVAPPPPRHEVIGVAPFAGGIWIDGYWSWTGNRHEWIAGRWETPHPGYRWVPHRWYHEHDGWHMAEGHWEPHR